MIKCTINFIVFTIFLSVVLVSCKKDDEHISNDECLCIFTDESGNFIGTDPPNATIPETLIFFMGPNPTYGSTYLIFYTAGLNIVTITDKSGKVLFNDSFDVQQDNDIYPEGGIVQPKKVLKTIGISVWDYPEGTYRVTVKNGTQKSTLCLKIEYPK